MIVSDRVWQDGRLPRSGRLWAGGLDHALVEVHDDHGCGDTCRPECAGFRTDPLERPQFPWAGRRRKVECGEQ